MGELVYQLKYSHDISAVKKIVDLLGKFKGLETMDGIIPIPPTKKNRNFQPVYEISRELGKRVQVPVLEHVLEKRAIGPELKDVNNPELRKACLEKQFFLSPHHLMGKSILIIDDIYRSGSTLAVATELLHQAKVQNVFVLTMTKTRSKR